MIYPSGTTVFSDWCEHLLGNSEKKKFFLEFICQFFSFILLVHFAITSFCISLHIYDDISFEEMKTQIREIDKDEKQMKIEKYLTRSEQMKNDHILLW